MQVRGNSGYMPKRHCSYFYMPPMDPKWATLYGPDGAILTAMCVALANTETALGKDWKQAVARMLGFRGRQRQDMLRSLDRLVDIGAVQVREGGVVKVLYSAEVAP